MAAVSETKVGFKKDLMRRVMKASEQSGHSAKAFIEECVIGCLDAIEETELHTPPIVMMVRRKLGKAVTLAPDAGLVRVITELLEKKTSAADGESKKNTR